MITESQVISVALSGLLDGGQLGLLARGYANWEEPHGELHRARLIFGNVKVR